MKKLEKWDIVIIVGLVVIAFIVYNLYTQGILLGEIDDAHLARIEAYYDADTDRLIVALILTNKDGDYTKANGHLELTVKNDRIQVYSTEHTFMKDAFFTWNTNFGGKVTGYRIDINKNFYSGSYDVYVDLETGSGGYWQDLHASFYSLE